MQYFIIMALLCATSMSVGALEVSIIKPCSNETLSSASVELEAEQSVGEVTLGYLSDANIVFEGTEQGVQSIMGTPAGLDAFEVVSELEMFGYGWCYSVNGVSPEVMPDQYLIKEGDHLVWWYGFAHFLNGEWVSQCTPSSSRSREAFCQKILGEN